METSVAALSKVEAAEVDILRGGVALLSFHPREICICRDLCEIETVGVKFRSLRKERY